MTHRNDDGDSRPDPESLLRHHRESGEPLGGHELDHVVAAGLASRDGFDMRGGDLWWETARFPDPDADIGTPDLPRPQDMATAEAFRDWLAAEVDRWCEAEGLTPHGEGENLGDLYREFDIADVFTRMGITAVPAYERHILYLIGPDAAWIASMQIELGMQYESLWPDPLGSLRVDVPPAELIAYRDYLRRTADEITAALDRGEGP